MAELGQLERSKRRRLQEAYEDLRPDTKRGDDRQAKLRSLLLGAAADAGLPSNSPQAVRQVAAAAAASIAAVSSPPGGRGGPPAGSRRAALRAATAVTAGSGSLVATASGAGSPATAQRWPSAPAQLTLYGSPGCGHRGGPAGAPGRHPRHPDAGPHARAPPPPGPMEGGFLHEADPVQRLSRLQAAGALPGIHVSGLSATASPPSAPATRAIATSPGGGGLAGGGLGGTAGGVRSPTAVRYDLPDEYDELLAEADVPSDVELALISLRSDMRAHGACGGLPPLALRSQLYDMLPDRPSVERQLDEQRRANRVRVFKLPTGADEFGVLATSDYRGGVREAADAAAAAASAQAAATSDQLQPPTRRAQSAPGALGAAPPAHSHAAGSLPCSAPQSSGAYGIASTWPCGGAACGGPAKASRWHVAAEAFLRGVVDRFTEFQLSHAHLLHLLATAPPVSQQAPQQVQGRPADGSSGQSEAAVEEQLSLLLHMGCLARHTDGDADAYVLAVPGAGKLVKAVLAGRRELTTWLSKRQHREAPEEQVAKLKLRGSCLPTSYHVKDLVGRGAAVRLPSTCGPMIRLAAARR